MQKLSDNPPARFPDRLIQSVECLGRAMMTIDAALVKTIDKG